MALYNENFSLYAPYFPIEAARVIVSKSLHNGSHLFPLLCSLRKFVDKVRVRSSASQGYQEVFECTGTTLALNQEFPGTQNQSSFIFVYYINYILSFFFFF